ncbi:MAG: anthranilate phosphoribosyltransferase [Desulfovibrionales bacterium]|jgi:anthranilate phosphoribosyltransferase|nr:anthranilate phosphoribosyltransferase [Desulfovibrionales bacterium]
MAAFKEILETLARGEDLSESLAEEAFGLLFTGQLGPAQSGAFLMGLRAKGETPMELACAVRKVLEHSKLLENLSGDRIDTCGTGGDNRSSFNCSTAVALFLADMGHQVVKHGNRAASSSSGSADALESLGLFKSDLTPEDVAAELAAKNFVFLFAPAYHPAFAHVMPVRRELGMRTLFNLIGPLLNPARPTHQLLGVPAPGFLPLVAEALRLTGVRRAAVVHGAGGYDELTTFGPNEMVMVAPEGVEKKVLDPAALGFASHAPGEVRVTDKEEAAAALKKVLSGSGAPAMQDMVALNLAVSLHLLTQEPIKECVATARDKVASGLSGGILDA